MTGAINWYLIRKVNRTTGGNCNPDNKLISLLSLWVDTIEEDIDSVALPRAGEMDRN